jgi:hypothetical protein
MTAIPAEKKKQLFDPLGVTLVCKSRMEEAKTLLIDLSKKDVLEMLRTQYDWYYELVSDMNKNLIVNPHFRITIKQLARLQVIHSMLVNSGVI